MHAILRSKENQSVQVARNLNARSMDGLARPTEHVDRRAFWIAQAKHHLARAREWRGRFDTFSDRVARFWYANELAQVARYRMWMRGLRKEPS